MTKTNPRVLIVGCGPTGLMLALQLTRYGIDYRIIDKYPAPLELSKSAALHARTLELYRAVGCADRILDEGQEVDILDLRTRYRDRIRVDFSVLEDTRHPFIIDLPQYRTEHIMLDRLAELGATLDREVVLEDLDQHDDGVTVRLRRPGTEAAETATYDWVIGCDGANSTVRGMVGQEFKGASYAEPWVLCDAQIDWPLPRNEMTFSSDSQGILGVFPLPGDKRYRIAYTQHRDATGELVEPCVQDMRTAMTRAGIDGDVIEASDFWQFRLDHRQVDEYRVGRVFLGGDAAHVHTPFGGQGMNLGLGDAYNLGWKLAHHLTGRAAPHLLDSYHTERHAIAREVVASTHLGASAMLLRQGPRARARDVLMHTLGRPARVRVTAARRLSQLSHSYRAHHVPWRSLDVGDRLPDLSFFDGFHQDYRRLYDSVDTLRQTVIVALAGKDADPAAMGEALAEARRADARTVLAVTDHRLLPRGADFDDVVYDRERRLAPLYASRPTAHVVRPDHHLAGVHVDVGQQNIRHALGITQGSPNLHEVTS